MNIGIAKEKDAQEVIELFCEDGKNLYDWSKRKWLHYYSEYTEGEPIGLVARKNGAIIGHYGLLPILVGDQYFFLGVHAYVSKKNRGLEVIGMLLSHAESMVKKRQYSGIVAFPNDNFSVIKERFFGWDVLAWLPFSSGLCGSDFDESIKRPFFFNYTDDWYLWRFGVKKDLYVSDYYDYCHGWRRQFLKKYRDVKNLEGNKFLDVEAWVPRTYSTIKPRLVRSQAFCLKCLDASISKENLINHKNWSIDMGDSDTFVYKCIEKNLKL